MEESAENVADRSVDQQQLSGVIKGVHKRLRRKYRDFVSHDDDGGQERRSWEEVWREHVQQEPAMQEYSRAMHSLACRVWKSRGESRLHWCVDACREYFLGGALQNLLLKDRRRRLRGEFCPLFFSSPPFFLFFSHFIFFNWYLKSSVQKSYFSTFSTVIAEFSVRDLLNFVYFVWVAEGTNSAVPENYACVQNDTGLARKLIVYEIYSFAKIPVITVSEIYSIRNLFVCENSRVYSKWNL